MFLCVVTSNLVIPAYFLEMPKVEGLVTTTKVGADFCISFSNPPSALQIICNDVQQFGAVPTPVLTWYKDDIVAITMDEFGQFSISEEFLNVSNNGLLRFGVLEPPPLVAIGTLPSSGGELFLNFMVTNVANPALIPPGVDMNNIVRELFAVLLGSWECRVNNTFGEDSAETELSDCGKLKCVWLFRVQTRESMQRHTRSLTARLCTSYVTNVLLK